ncbi:hypothetical protein NEOLEDRAFT_1140067 [Neolentinus lepideus HHB14362 ss-1]|uniref:Uncharacterized protein n=1 Tax=Neolentinus lepideus HHB14362 ss-1 TaxID=1314782 RepID=A0A165PH02_9AGAM|nr:hypothetical protein NEOLEDRAFT_1140067 [Neolentinus lepideus HHB14362 ss-1]
MGDVQVLKPTSPLSPPEGQAQIPDTPSRMRTYCANLSSQNGTLQRRLQRSDEANAFLKAHTEQLKFEIAQAKSELSMKARNVMALQFKLLRQDLLNCASQAAARKTSQELKDREERLEKMGCELEMLKAENAGLAKEVERLGFAVTGVQYVADKLEARNKDLEEEVERLRVERAECEREIREKDEEVRRTREKMEVLEEYVAASKEADELVSDTFTTVLATLDAWKRGDESDEVYEEEGVSEERVQVQVPRIVVSEVESDEEEVVVMKRRRDEAWSHEAILDSWTAPPATDAYAVACPSSLSCTIALPTSPTLLEVSPITPTGPLADIEEEEEEGDEPVGQRESSSSSSQFTRAKMVTFDCDTSGSPTVVGSGSEMDTESENESLADDEHEHASASSRPKVYDNATDSPMLLFHKFAHGIPEDEFAPLIHERFSPVDVRFENSDDEACNRFAASFMMKRSNSLSSIGTCDGLETFRRDFSQPKIPSPLGRRRPQDRLSCKRRAS